MDTTKSTTPKSTTTSSSSSSDSTDLLLGIDIGTQGLTCLLCRYDNLEVVGKGEGSYGFVPDLLKGQYEQTVQSWSTAMDMAMKQLHTIQEKSNGRHAFNKKKVCGS